MGRDRGGRGRGDDIGRSLTARRKTDSEIHHVLYLVALCSRAAAAASRSRPDSIQASSPWLLWPLQDSSEQGSSWYFEAESEDALRRRGAASGDDAANIHGKLIDFLILDGVIQSAAKR